MAGKRASKRMSKKVASKKVASKKASKRCDRGNKAGSIKVKGYTRDGKRVLCYRRRKPQ